jgi:NurA-like 5'-3' nuclease
MTTLIHIPEELKKALNKSFVTKSGKNKEMNNMFKDILDEIQIDISLLNVSDNNNTKKPKNIKKVKDPNAPKKPLSNYMIFCNAYKAKHKGEKKITELTKDAADIWNSVKTDNEKVKNLFEEYNI